MRIKQNQSSGSMRFQNYNLRCNISSNLADLDRLHQTFQWIPNSTQIRPSAETMQIKRLFCQNIEENWHSFGDFILETVFKKISTPGYDGLKYCADKDVDLVHIFAPNQFPYDLNEGEHWVISHNIL